jgi:UDP-galactopyranose mutase
MIAADDPIWVANEADIPYAYVVYDHARANNVKIIKSWLSERDIIAAGRYAEWEYYNSDHAFIAGKNAAQAARELAGAAAPAVAATSTTAAATSVSSTALSSAVLSSSGLTGDNRGGGRSGARAAKLGV